MVGTSTDTDIFVVKSDGNVGIGTTAPESALHINKGYDAGIQFGDPAWTEYGKIHYSGSTNILDIQSLGTNTNYGQIALKIGRASCRERV